jgi:putative peptide maturation system protein
MILIVSSAGDDHVATVEPELRRRGASVLLLDLAELPSRAQLSVAYQPGARARTVLRLRDSEVDLGAVTAVWSRRPRVPSPDAQITNGALRDYVRQETTDAWIGASALLDCPWLPGPRWQELRAGYKALQLQIAADLGFEIPPTLVTNSAEDFLDFYRRHNGAVVSKAVHNRLLPVDRPEGYDAYVLTDLVANRDLVDVNAIRYCPVTVQPYVEKRVELRITVVGDRVFPVEIDSQWTNHTRHDWRRGDHHHARYAVHKLPPDVERRCVELVERLGLRFGAIDLILTPDERYVFLEINPNGAWLWMERTTGLQISTAISDLLMSGEATAPSTRVAQRTGQAATTPQLLESDTPAFVRPLEPTRRTNARIPQAAVAATLKYLGRLASARTPAAEAVVGLRRLAKRHRGIRMDLVWEVESYLGNTHYDALLRIPSGGTISLAFSPRGCVPWAFRHAHHARETDLLRVNGRTLNMQSVMGYLDGLWYDARLLTALVDGCLVREAVDSRGIEASADEVRRATGDFERKAGLASVEARNSWLQGRGWTRDDLEHEIRRQVIARKLRKQIVGGEIDSYFAGHCRELDTATFVRVRFANDGEAREIAGRIKRSAVGLSQGAEEAIVTGATTTARSEIATVRHRDLAPAYAESVFAASPGEVIGPLKCSDGHDIVRVLRTVQAKLDESTRELITGILFDEWLAKRRDQATVEWFWGDAERAPRRPGTFK